MPVTAFSSDNVRTSATSFPKVKLAKNEKGRLVCIEPNPHYEWVHELKKPVVSKVNGKPVMETREKANGEKYETYQMDFIGRPVCVGDPDVLEDRGADPDHCPACEIAKDSDMLPGPVRRYAIHVLQYATKTGSTQIAEPFSVATKVWTLTEKRFAEVVELINEAEVDDPRKIDITLEQKGPEAFQQYDMKLGTKCEMLANQDRLDRAKLTYQENHAPDLSPYCGRDTPAKYITEDCREIEDAWQRVRRAEAAAGGAEPMPTLDAEETSLDASLLDSVGTGAGSQQSALTSAVEAEDGRSLAGSASAPVRDKAAERAPESGLDEFAPDTTQNTEEDARNAAPASSVQPSADPESAERKAAPKAEAVSFDDLMQSLAD